jgi:hypothetical protein
MTGKIMFALKGIFVVACFIVTIVFMFKSCQCDPYSETIKFNVQKVFMNESTRFTFLVDDSLKEVNLLHGDVKIYFDIKSDAPMYIVYHQECIGGTLSINYLEMHLHSKDDLNGGGWDHGKFGRGQTNVIGD